MAAPAAPTLPHALSSDLRVPDASASPLHHLVPSTSEGGNSGIHKVEKDINLCASVDVEAAMELSITTTSDSSRASAVVNDVPAGTEQTKRDTIAESTPENFPCKGIPLSNPAVNEVPSRTEQTTEGCTGEP